MIIKFEKFVTITTNNKQQTTNNKKMLRQSAVDMENSENLLGEDPDVSVYNARAKYLGMTCL